MTAASLEGLRAAGVLTALDEHLARTLGRLAADERPLVLLAVAVASANVREGHVCVDLSDAAGPPLAPDAEAAGGEPAWPEPRAWRELLRASPLVGDGEAAAPLVLDCERLYLRRYWQHERRLAEAIRARLGQADEPIDAAWLRGALERLFGPAPAGTADPRHVAALMALGRRFAVVAGGPGTGKTWTVVRLLALLLEQAFRAGKSAPAIALLAPTGKAAARLVESIRDEKAALRCDERVRASLPDEAKTVHRALRPVWGSTTQFRHGPDSPLPADIVLVDEASMVDVALMARLSAALAPSARLVLLGDPHQLASVEAGAILGDLCAGAERPCFSAAFAREASRLLGSRVEAAPSAPAAAPWIGDSVVLLDKSHRFAEGSGIGALASAVRQGDGDLAMSILTSGRPDVALGSEVPDGKLGPEVESAVLAGYGAYLEAATPRARLAALRSFRVLCAHRRGPWGVESLNTRIEAALARARLLSPHPGVYAGRPILVTSNDYGVRLFNGDVGLACAGAAGVFVAFEGPDGQLREVAPSRLPPHETAFAMTVHKSQGSEHDTVAVVLPAAASPLLTRELLYTAVTRARKKVLVLGGEAAVRAAVSRPVRRVSGLADRLWKH